MHKIIPKKFDVSVYKIAQHTFKFNTKSSSAFVAADELKLIP